MFKTFFQKEETVEVGLLEQNLYRYIMPCNQFTAKLKNGKIHQTYTVIDRNPIKITINEKVKFSPLSNYTAFYILKVNYGDLILRSLTEFSPQGKVIEYDADYPYIRFPNKSNKCCWTYRFCNIQVNCTSEFSNLYENGIDYDALFVTREFDIADAKNRLNVTECYVDGYGIISKTYDKQIKI